MKRIISAILTALLLFGVCSGTVYASNYSEDYTKWSQTDSDDPDTRKYGCVVVALSIMLRDCGVDTSIDFNPDVFRDWERANGYLDSGYYQHGWGAAPAYASERGFTLEYAGRISENITDAVRDNIKKGYYSIICMRNLYGGSHFALVNNEETAKDTEIRCYNIGNPSAKLSEISTGLSYLISYSPTDTPSKPGGLPKPEISSDKKMIGTRESISFTCTGADEAAEFEYYIFKEGKRYYTGNASASREFSYTFYDEGSYEIIASALYEEASSYSDILRVYVTDPTISASAEYYSIGEKITINVSGLDMAERFVLEAVSASGSVSAEGKLTSGKITLTINKAGNYKATVVGLLGQDKVKSSSTEFHVKCAKHTYTKWTESIAAECTEGGVETSICDVCTYRGTRSTSPAGHTLILDTVVKQPTFEEGGIEKRVCSKCGFIAFVNTERLKKVSEIYKDVKEDWAYDGISYCVTNGLMNGTSSDMFSPGAEMSRAMLVTVLWRADGEEKVSSVSPFVDLKADWYKDAVAWAYSNGIVNGVSADKFSPDGKLSREQIAAILFRYAEYKGRDITPRAYITSYPDNKSVSAWAYEPLRWAVACSYIRGFEEGGVSYLRPSSGATRAQVATILYRFFSDNG